MDIKIDDTYNSSCGDQQFLGIVKIRKRKKRWPTEESRDENNQSRGVKGNYTWLEKKQ